jgi:Tol biopolymer transport system component
MKMGGDAKLVLVDRQGQARPLTEIIRRFRDPRFSPDGKQLALGVFPDVAGTTNDIWILDLTRGALTRLTYEESGMRPLWSPDGERLYFGSSQLGGYNIFSKSTDGSGVAKQLTFGAYRAPTSISSDGKTLLFRQWGESSSWDIGMVRLEEDTEPEILLAMPFDEHTGMLSPNDRWLAYVSNESGRNEVYVQDFPAMTGKRQVSTEGGTEPMWSPDGGELFYRSGDKMMAVAIAIGADFAPAEPALLFERAYQNAEGTAGAPSSNYDVASNGQHFVMLQEVEEVAPTQITVVLNWAEELKRLVPKDE